MLHADITIAVSDALRVVGILAAAFIGYIGIMIMLWGGIRCGWHFLLYAMRGGNHMPYIRIDLGKHLALGLEFLVGKDIIESIVHETWEDLQKLAVIIVLRTIVTLILSWEISEIRRQLRDGELTGEQEKHAIQHAHR